MGQSLSSLSVVPATARSGVVRTGTVTLSGAAPAGGVAVALSSSLAAATVPATVTVPAGVTTATFSIPTQNAGYSNLTATIAASSGGIVKTANVTVNPANSSAFVGQTVASSMVAGQTYPVTLQFQNTGSTTWDAAHFYKLQSRNPTDNLTWGTKRLRLVNAPVAPGQLGTFTGQVVAPLTAGTYNFQWMCIQDDIALPFGVLSTNSPVTVAVAPDAAQFVSQTAVPTKLVGGAAFTVSLTYKNVGTSTWSTASLYALRSLGPFGNTLWGTSEVALPSSVSPGSTVTFTQTFHAPTTRGTYFFQWGMVHGSAFGDRSPGTSIQVIQDDAVFVSQKIATTVYVGQQFYPQYIFKNTGSTTWSSLIGYWSVSYNPSMNSTWGIVRGHLPYNLPVAPGENAVITPLVTAPSTPGTYTMQWRMSRNDAQFGQPTTAVTIRVIPLNPEDAQVTAQTIPVSATAGQHYVAQVTFKNVGTSDWPLNTAIGVYPQPNTKWALDYLKTGSIISKGNSRTYTVDLVAPYLTGNQPLQFRMRDLGTNAWFGQATTPVTVSVMPSGYAESPWPGARGGRARRTGRGFGSGATGVSLWTFNGGGFRDEPTIGADGTVYIGSDDHKLYAINGVTGALKWSFDTGSIILSAPAIGSDGTVYFGSSGEPVNHIGGKFYALDGATGAVKWSFTSPTWGFADPAIEPDGTVIVPERESVYAFDGATGAVKWHVPLTGNFECAPTIGEDGTIYLPIAQFDGSVVALDPATGATKWQLAFPDQGGSNSTVALGVDGTLYVASQGNRIYAIDTANHTIKWSFTTGGSNFRGPAVGQDGTVYCGSQDHMMYAINGATGALKWSLDTGSQIMSAPSVGADGTVYIANMSTLYGLDGSTGAQKFAISTPAVMVSTLAIGADGTLYFGAGSTVRAVK